MWKWNSSTVISCITTTVRAVWATESSFHIVYMSSSRMSSSSCLRHTLAWSWVGILFFESYLLSQTMTREILICFFSNGWPYGSAVALVSFPSSSNKTSSAHHIGDCKASDGAMIRNSLQTHLFSDGKYRRCFEFTYNSFTTFAHASS